MEILVIILIGAGIAYWMYRNVYISKPETKSEDKGIVAVGEPPATVAVDGAGSVSWHTAPPEGSKLAENTLDVNHDGKVDLQDVKEAVKKVRSRVKKTADVNGDGKVTKADAKAAVKKVAATAKKTTGRKPKA